MLWAVLDSDCYKAALAYFLELTDNCLVNLIARSQATYTKYCVVIFIGSTYECLDKLSYILIT